MSCQTYGQMNSHFEPVLPTQVPSGQSLASCVQGFKCCFVGAGLIVETGAVWLMVGVGLSLETKRELFSAK